MKDLKTLLNEGVFDAVTDDEVAKLVNGDIINNFFEKYTSGRFTKVIFKDGSVRITGSIFINKYDKETLPIKIRDFKGSINIDDCPNLKSVGDTFKNTICLHGSLTINKCPKFDSLEGVPAIIDKDLIISNCKSLKNIRGGAETVFGNFIWVNNGKKYTKEQIEKVIKVYKRIDCSEKTFDEILDESVVNEDLNNVWLQKLTKQLKKYPVTVSWWNDEVRAKKLKEILPDAFFDRLTAKDIDVLDLKDKTDLAAAYRAIKTSNALIIYNDTEDRFDAIITYTEGGSGSLTYLPGGAALPGYYSTRNTPTTYSGIKDDISHLAVSTKSDYKILALNFPKDMWKELASLRGDRSRSKEGMINPGDAEQYEKIAKENRQRYKNELAKLRANKERDRYASVDDDIEDIMNRVFKLTRDAKRNPGKYSKYDVSRIIEMIYDKATYERGHTYGDYGLLYRFDNFNKVFETCFGKNGAYNSNPTKSDFDSLNKSLEGLKKYIVKCDEKLRAMGF